MNTLFSTNEAHHTLILGAYFVVSVHNFHNGKCGKRLGKRVNASKNNLDFPQICYTTHFFNCPAEIAEIAEILVSH